MRHRSGVGRVNDPHIVHFLKTDCNWPPTYEFTPDNNNDGATSQNFQAPVCGGGDKPSRESGDNVGDSEDKAVQTLKEEMRRDLGQRICTTAGGEDGCGDGVSCRETTWRGVIGQVLLGVASIVEGSGVCVYE